MAIKRTCDICGKEIKGEKNEIRGYKNTLFGSTLLFTRDLCNECFRNIQRETLKKND